MPRGFTETERERIREQLLDAGREAAARTGLRRTPVDALCRAAGISKGAFYLFFDSKEALAIELLVAAETELRAVVRDAARTGPPGERLRNVLHAIFRAVTRHPLLRALADPEEWAWLTRCLPPGQLEAARADDDAFFASILSELREAGAVRDLPEQVFAGLGGMGLAVAVHPELVGDDRAEAVLDAVVEGLVSRYGAG